MRWRIRIRSGSPSCSHGHRVSQRLPFRPKVAFLSSRPEAAPLSSRPEAALLSSRPEATLLSSRLEAAPLSSRAQPPLLSSRAQPRDLAANGRCATSAGRCLGDASLRSTLQTGIAHGSTEADAAGMRRRIRIRSGSPPCSDGYGVSPQLSSRPHAALLSSRPEAAPLSSRPEVAPLSSRAQPRDLAANGRCATSAGRCLGYASLRST